MEFTAPESDQLLSNLTKFFREIDIEWDFHAVNGGRGGDPKTTEVLLWSQFYWTLPEIPEAEFLEQIAGAHFLPKDNFCTGLCDENLVLILSTHAGWIELPSIVGNICKHRQFTSEYQVSYEDAVYVNPSAGLFVWETHADGIDAGAAFCPGLKTIPTGGQGAKPGL